MSRLSLPIGLTNKGCATHAGNPIIRMTQGKIERWHLSLKSRILLENYYLPGDLERAVATFVQHYNHSRYHESLDNLTPADVYFGRGQRILITDKPASARALNSHCDSGPASNPIRLKW
jgi:hypothetical protein